MTGIALATIAGCLGGAWHLGVLAWRAERVTSGHPLAAMVFAPVGWLGPVGATLAVASTSPDQVWAVVIGLVLARVGLVMPLGRLLEEGSWR